MANVLHKTADPVDYRVSVNTPDFPTADWFINPDVSLVAGVPKKYWRRPLLDPVTEMTQPEKDLVDAAEAQARIDANRAESAATPDDTDTAQGCVVRAIIELFNKRDNYLTNRIVELQEDLQAIKASTGGTANIRDAIRARYLATKTRARPAAVQDYKDIVNNGEADN